MTGRIAVVFDLDGTLIDSAPDLRAALNRRLAARGLGALSPAAVRGMIGDGARVLLARAFAARGSEAGAADFTAFLADYEARSTVETVLYPGIEAVLRRLAGAGHRLAICTNKPTAASERILEKFALLRFFETVVGGDATPHLKPDPRHLAAAVAALGGGRAVMIGDHENDLAAARGLGLPAIFVAWGYGKGRGSLRAEAAGELPGLIAGL